MITFLNGRSFLKFGLRRWGEERKMAEEKYDAKRLDFVYNQLVLGGFSGDQDWSVPAVLIYAPGPGVLVETDPHTEVLFGPPESRSAASIGEAAQKRYDALVTELSSRGIEPKSVEVTQEFVDWGRALQRVQNPSKSLVDFLEPKR